MRMVLVRTPIEHMDSQLATFCGPKARLPLGELCCIWLSCWPKGSCGAPQTTQAYAKTQMENWALLPGISSTKITERGKVELVPVWSLHSYGLVLVS